MELIARGQPRAKLDDTGSVIELRIPTGDREKIIFDLTPNQSFMLEQLLRRANIAFFEARSAAKRWQAENVIPISRARRA
jgi:hypothetical protein